MASPLALYFPETCLTCGARGPVRRIGEAREHEYEGTTDALFPVHECPARRLVFLYPRPDVSEIPRIYPSHYYSYDERAKAAEGQPSSAASGSFTRSLFKRLNAARLLARQVGFACVRAESCRTSKFWVMTTHSLLLDLAGRRVTDALFPPVKVCYGGAQSFVLLGFFTVLEGALRLFTGKANSMWLLLRKERPA